MLNVGGRRLADLFKVKKVMLDYRAEFVWMVVRNAFKSLKMEKQQLVG